MAIYNSFVDNLTTSQIFLSTGEIAVTTMIFCNVTTGTTALLDVYVVPLGQNPGGTDPNQIMKGVILPPGETFVLDTERLILAGGDSIFAGVNSEATSSTIVATVSTVVVG